MLERFETDAGRLEIILHYLRKDAEIKDLCNAAGARGSTANAKSSTEDKGRQASETKHVKTDCSEQDFNFNFWYACVAMVFFPQLSRFSLSGFARNFWTSATAELHGLQKELPKNPRVTPWTPTRTPPNPP